MNPLGTGNTGRRPGHPYFMFIPLYIFEESALLLRLTNR
jgi:hypothetical protein